MSTQAEAPPVPVPVPPPAGQRRRAPRWLWAMLAVSLAANFLVLGMALRFVFRPPFAADPLAGNLARYVGELPQDRRQALRKVMAANRPDRQVLMALRLQVRNARRVAADLLRAEPFDKDRYEDAVKAVTAAEVAVRDAIQHATPEVLSHMSAAERSRLLSWSDARRPPVARWLAGEDAPPPRK